MLRRKFLAVICSVGLLIGCQTTDNHIWVTDLSARQITPTTFSLRNKIRIGIIERYTDNAPKNAEQAVVTSFRKNNFLAKTLDEATYILDVKILEYAEDQTQRSEKASNLASQLNVADDAVIMLNAYFLRSVQSGATVREINIFTTYHKLAATSGVLISFGKCNQTDITLDQQKISGAGPSERAKALSEWKKDQHHANIPQSTGSDKNKNDPAAETPNSSVYQPKTDEAFVAGVIATILVVGILTGGRVIPIPYYGSSGALGGADSPWGIGKYRSSISRGRAFQNNLIVAVEQLSRERL